MYVAGMVENNFLPLLLVVALAHRPTVLGRHCLLGLRRLVLVVIDILICAGLIRVSFTYEPPLALAPHRTLEQRQVNLLALGVVLNRVGVLEGIAGGVCLLEFSVDPLETGTLHDVARRRGFERSRLNREVREHRCGEKFEVEAVGIEKDLYVRKGEGGVPLFRGARRVLDGAGDRLERV